MKRILCMLLAAVMLSLTACSEQSSGEEGAQSTPSGEGAAPSVETEPAEEEPLPLPPFCDEFWAA